MRAEHERFGNPAERPPRGGEAEDVGHDGVAAVGREVVVVGQTGEGAAEHDVAEVVRRIESGDLCGQLLTDTEMAGFEGDDVIQLQPARGRPSTMRSPVQDSERSWMFTSRASSKQTDGGAAMRVWTVSSVTGWGGKRRR